MRLRVATESDLEIVGWRRGKLKANLEAPHVRATRTQRHIGGHLRICCPRLGLRRHHNPPRAKRRERQGEQHGEQFHCGCFAKIPAALAAPSRHLAKNCAIL